MVTTATRHDGFVLLPILHLAIHHRRVLRVQSSVVIAVVFPDLHRTCLAVEFVPIFHEKAAFEDGDVEPADEVGPFIHDILDEHGQLITESPELLVYSPVVGETL